MEPGTADNAVPREIKARGSIERVILRESKRAVTPLGGVAVFVVFLQKLGWVEKVRQHLPIQGRSPNQIDPPATFTAFLLVVRAGAKPFAPAHGRRGDRALQARLGFSRFPMDDPLRNRFRRFGMGEGHRRFDPWAEWPRQRLPPRRQGYRLDLDSTGFER
jgi:hypothetical protein